MIRLDADGLLIRPRLFSHFRRAVPGGLIVIRSMHLSGASVVASQWIADSNRSALWWSAGRDLGAIEDVLDDTDFDTVVLPLIGHPYEAKTILAIRQLRPAATLILPTVIDLPPEVAEQGIAPDVYIHPRDLMFTPDEIRNYAASRDLTLDEPALEMVVAATRGAPLLVDEVIRAAERLGSADDTALRKGLDSALARGFSTTASAPIGDHAREVLTAVALSTPTPEEVLAAISALSPETAATVRAMRDSEFLTRDHSGAFTLPKELTDAVAARTRAATWPPAMSAFIRTLTPALIDHGLFGALIDWSAGDVGLRNSLLTSHWDELARVDPLRARTLLADLPTPTPGTRVAHARALVDVTHAGHDGHISPMEQDVARQQLLAAREEASGQEGELFDALLASTEAIMMRLDGRPEEALAVHRRLADSVDPGTPLGGYLQLQVAMSAIETGDFLEAVEVLEASAAQGNWQRLDTTRDLVGGFLTYLDEDGSWPHHVRQVKSRGLGTVRAFTVMSRTWDHLYALDLEPLYAQSHGSWRFVDDPLTLGGIKAITSIAILSMLQMPQQALRIVELVERRIAHRKLSGLHRGLLSCARADALYYLGRHEDSLEVCRAAIAADTRPRCRIRILAARALLAMGKPADAEKQLTEVLDGVDPYGRTALLCSALLFLARRQQDDDDGATEHLLHALSLASRPHDLLPFTLAGIPAMRDIVSFADGLTLDRFTRQFVDELHEAYARVSVYLPHAKLTERQREILQMMQQVDGVRQLASALYLSQNTVKSQLKRIYRSLGVNSWAEAVRAAENLR